LDGQWVLLTYWVPREPSTPRIAVWRKLKRLGVAQLGDGLAALPADPRTREQLEWIAQDIVEAGGTAGVWLAEPTDRAQVQALIAGMAGARAAEYDKIRAEADSGLDLDSAARAGLVRRLRGELRRVERRDFFPPAERDAAHSAVEGLAEVAVDRQEEPA
jgi:hypothetical protein